MKMFLRNSGTATATLERLFFAHTCRKCLCQRSTSYKFIESSWLLHFIPGEAGFEHEGSFLVSVSVNVASLAREPLRLPLYPIWG
jgi:hypothetical protein